jgi:hypothetical protein
MRRHRHRLSKDIDIFLDASQVLNYLSPRLNDAIRGLSPDYVEQANSLKVRFVEGEVDFIVAGPLTPKPYVIEEIQGRSVRVETSVEIVAKKVWHRGEVFTARDIFDLAMVGEREPSELISIQPILRDKREVILRRVTANGPALREAFDALEVLDYRRTFDDCVSVVERITR